MNLNPIAANMNEVEFRGGLTVLFSYKTPVACVWTNGISNIGYKTQKTWSNTTTRHINKWFANWTLTDLTVKPQEFFDNLIAEGK